MKPILLILSLAVPCLAAPEKNTIEAGGLRREYLLVRPSKDAAKPYPLVLVLHGHLGSAAQVLGLKRAGHSALSRWTKLAESEGLLVAAPDGLVGADRAQGWNDCRSDAKNDPTSDDTAFLNALAARLIKEEGADPKRIYVTGMSNGAMMTLRAALEMNPPPAAVAPICGSMAVHSACSAAKRPVSLLLIAGTEDPLVPFEGGEVGFKKRRDRGAVVPMEDVVSYWLKADGLTGEPRTEKIPHLDESDPTSVSRRTWGAPEGPQVVSVTVTGGGHQEPSPTVHAAKFYSRLVGPQNRDYESADEAWAFFKTKRRIDAKP